MLCFQAILRKINKNQDAKITKKEYLEAMKQPGINNSQYVQSPCPYDDRF